MFLGLRYSYMIAGYRNKSGTRPLYYKDIAENSTGKLMRTE